MPPTSFLTVLASPLRRGAYLNLRSTDETIERGKTAQLSACEDVDVPAAAAMLLNKVAAERQPFIDVAATGCVIGPSSPCYRSPSGARVGTQA